MKKEKETKPKKLGSLLRTQIGVSIIITFFITLVLSNFLLSGRTKQEIQNILATEVSDVSAFVEEQYQHEMRDILENMMHAQDDSFGMEDSKFLIDNFDLFFSQSLTELNVVDGNGIIVYSTDPRYLNFDMASGEQSAEFLTLLNGEKFMAQDFRENAFGDGDLMAYSGMAFDDGKGFLQVGLSMDQYEKMINGYLEMIIKNEHIGQTGYLLICDRDGEVLVSTGSKYDGERLPIAPKDMTMSKLFKLDLFGEQTLCFAEEGLGIYILAVYPQSEAQKSLRTQILMTVLVFAIAFVVVTVFMTFSLRRYVLNEVKELNGSMKRISEGDLAERVGKRKTEELNEVADGINNMVDRLEEMIKEADTRMETELSMAQTIQTSVLPAMDAQFTTNRAFSLFASMDAARTVGGDFYDFYMISDNVVAFLIADVSDKGIPAAMFMMRAKSVIKSYAQRGLPVDEVCTCANRELCRGNDGGMFVTVWIGFVDLRIGRLTYVHAGHTRPVLLRNQKADFIHQKREFLMGGRENTVYTAQEWRLKRGDTIFLYTDGVTEACNENNEMYGNERLLALFDNEISRLEIADSAEYTRTVCKKVHMDVNRFVNGFTQSDDLTVLCFRYNGREMQ